MTVEELYKKQQEDYKKILSNTQKNTNTNTNTNGGLGNFMSNIFKQSNVFDDGYDFGDVTKSLLGTIGSIVGHGVKGVASIGEGIVDTTRYGLSYITKKASTSTTGNIEGWLYDYSDRVKERAQEDTMGQVTSKPMDWVDQYSWIGNSGQSVIEGMGYSLGLSASGNVLGAIGGSGAANAGTKVLTYAVGAANGMTEAYENGATDDEAIAYGMITGFGEVLTESMFAMMSGSSNILGITKGAIPIDDWAVKKVTSLIPSQFAKTKVGTEILIRAGFEGLEEVFSGYIGAAGKYLTYQTYDKGYEFSEILKNEDLASQFVAGAMSAGFMQASVQLARSAQNSRRTKNLSKIGTNQDINQDINQINNINEEIIKQVNKEVYKNPNAQINQDGIKAMDINDIDVEINSIDKILYETNINDLTPERVQELQSRKNELITQRNEKYNAMTDKGKATSKKILDNQVKGAVENGITTPKSVDAMEELNQVNTSIDATSNIPTAQNTTNVDLNSEQLKTAAQAYIDSVNTRRGDTEQIKLVENLTPQQKIIEDLSRAFGKQVVFVSNSDVSGLTVGDKVPNVLFIDVDAKTASFKGSKNSSLLYTTWHELFHSLSYADAETKKAFTEYVMNNITSEQVVNFMETYDPMDTQGLLEKAMINGEVDVEATREHPRKYKSQRDALLDICEEIAANEFGSMMTDEKYMSNLSMQDSTLYNNIVSAIQNSFKSLNKSIYNSALTQQQINDLRNMFNSVVTKITQSNAKGLPTTETTPIVDENSSNKNTKSVEKVQNSAENDVKTAETQIEPTKNSEILSNKKATATENTQKSVEKSEKPKSPVSREDKNFERLTLEEQDSNLGIEWSEEDKAYVEELTKKQKQAEKEEIQERKRQKEQLKEREKLVKKQEQVMEKLAKLPSKSEVTTSANEEVKTFKMSPEQVLTSLENNLKNYESGKTTSKSSGTHILTDDEKASLLRTMNRQYETYKKLGGSKVIDMLETQVQVIRAEEKAKADDFKNNLKKILDISSKALPKSVERKVRGIFQHEEYANNNLRDILNSLADEGKLYTPGTHEQYASEAQRLRADIDANGATEYVMDIIDGKRDLTPADNALIVNITNDLSTNGYNEIATALITKMVEQGTKNAQYLESMKQFDFDTLNPTAKATYLGVQYEKAAQKLNSEIDTTNANNKTANTNKIKEKLTTEELSFIEDAYNKAEAETNPIRKEIYEARIAQYLGNKLDSANVSLDKKLRAWRDLALLGNFKTQGKNLASNAFIKPLNKLADYLADKFGKSITNKLLAEGSKKTGFDTSKVGQTSYGKEITKTSLDNMLRTGQISEKTYKGVMDVWNELKLDTDNINSAIPENVQKKLPKKVQDMLHSSSNTLSKDAMKFGVIESILETKAGVRGKDSLARWDIQSGDFAPTTKIFNENRTENTTLDKVLNKVGKFLNKASIINYGTLEASDAGYEQMYYYDRLVELMITNNTSEPTTWMKDLAKSEAQKRTWKNEGKFAKTLTGLRNAFNNITIGTKQHNIGLGDLLMPYVTSTANISVALYDYSPLAYMSVVKSAIELNTAMKNGNTADVRQAQFNFQNTFGKASAGTLLYIVASALAGAGVLTGGEPDDEKAKEVLKQTGWQKYSIKIGNTYWSYDWTEPVGKSAALAVDLYQDLIKKTGSEDDNSNGLQTILKAANKLGSTMYEDSPLNSLSNLLTSYTYSDDPTNLIIDFVGNSLSQFLPTIGQQLADMLDPTSKVIYESKHPFVTMRNKLLAKIPIAKSLLATKKTTLGDTVYKYPTGYSWFMSPFNSFLALGNISVDTDDAVANEFARIYNETGENDYMPYKVNNQTIKGLSKAEQQKLQESIGKTTKDIMTTLMNTTAYKTADTETQGEAVKAMIEYAKGKAIYESGLKEGYELTGKAKALLEMVENGVSEENAAIYVGFISTIKNPNGGPAKNGSKAYGIMNLNISDKDKNELLYILADYKKDKAETVNTLSKLTTEQQFIDYFALPKHDYTKIENISREDYNIANNYYNIDSGSFTKYASDLSEIKSDYDKLGNAIPNSKKRKVLNYVNSLKISMPQKIFLIHMMGYSVKNYKAYMISYINSLNISNEEKRTLYNNLGF